MTAVVTGAGCIGLVSMMALKAMGVTRIIAVDVMEKRLNKALELAATEVVNGKAVSYTHLTYSGQILKNRGVLLTNKSGPLTLSLIHI